VSLFSWRPRVSDAEIRAEIWRLGGRHNGEPLEGALAELGSPDVAADRVPLLQACVRQLRRS